MIALALIGLAVVQVLAFSAILARQSRAHARREDLILNKLLHAAGKTWVEPPREPKPKPKPNPDMGRFTRLPEEL